MFARQQVVQGCDALVVTMRIVLLARDQLAQKLQRLTRRQWQIPSVQIVAQQARFQIAGQEVLLQRRVRKPKIAHALAGPQHKRSCAKILFQDLKFGVPVAGSQDISPHKLLPQPVADFVPLPFATSLGPHGGGDVLHQRDFVFRPNVVLAAIPREPAGHQHVVQCHAVNGFAPRPLLFQRIDLRHHQRQQQWPPGQLFQVMHTAKQFDGRIDPLRADGASEVIANLLLVEGQQHPRAVVMRFHTFAVFAQEQRILFPQRLEVVRATREHQATVPHTALTSLPPHFRKGQGFPQHAHQSHALVFVQMHQFLVQPIQDQDCAVLLNHPHNVLATDARDIAAMCRPPENFVQQFHQVGGDLLLFLDGGDEQTQVDVDGQR